MFYKTLLKYLPAICVLPFALLAPLSFGAEFGTEKVSFSGRIETSASATACGVCSVTHSVVDTSGTLSLQIGNSFVDLSLISDDEQTHQFTGYFYQTTGQRGINQCTLFAIEQIDTQQTRASSYTSSTEKISIQSVVIDGNSDAAYSVTLAAPFNVDSATLLSPENLIPQGGDCSAQGAVCSSGTVCLAYFGIAGGQGPEFKSCEIPCSLPGASCPLGQSCTTIADGPGLVCRVD
jgi:hypothetical protein